MSIAENTGPEASLSVDAYDAISQFAGTFDDIVLELATALAAKRRPGDHQSRIEVEVEDVVEARRILAGAIRRAVEEGDLSSASLRNVDELLRTVD